jgi:hypothetical protein
MIFLHVYNLPINQGGCHAPQGVFGGLFLYVKTAAFGVTLKAAVQYQSLLVITGSTRALEPHTACGFGPPFYKKYY